MPDGSVRSQKQGEAFCYHGKKPRPANRTRSVRFPASTQTIPNGSFCLPI